jgi:hypothetical protein
MEAGNINNKISLHASISKHCFVFTLGKVYTTEHKTKQNKTRQDKTRQDQTRQDKTRQDKTRQDKTRQDKGTCGV